MTCAPAELLPSSVRRSTSAVGTWRTTAQSRSAPTPLKRFAATFASCGFRPSAFHPCYGLAEATLLVSGGSLSDEMFRTMEVAPFEQNRVVEAGAEQQNVRTLSAAATPCTRPRLSSLIPNIDGLRAGSSRRDLGVRAERHEGYWNDQETDALVGLT